MRGAWIEISPLLMVYHCPLSLPVRGAWIEMYRFIAALYACSSSLPVRGAWIEINAIRARETELPVAPRAGSVD